MTPLRAILLCLALAATCRGDEGLEFFESKIRPVQHAIDIEAARQEWPFRAAQKPPVPDRGGSSWPRTDIDCFILQRLTDAQLAPAQDASRRTLIRRAYFDLTGLPPTPQEIEAFLADTSAGAFAKVVDRLLDSPRFGERWGRHWLDVARFAESSGGGRSLMFPNAWRYRDYVIQSFNQDKPFDVFLTEQIAGDLLSADSPQQRDEQLVATGFLVLGPTNYELQDKELLRMEVVDEQLDVIGRGFMALTLGCARCHDHKFDPVTTRDYYSLAGIFSSTRTLTPGNVSGYIEQTLASDKNAAQHAAHAIELNEANNKLTAAKKRLEQLRKSATTVGLVVEQDQTRQKPADPQLPEVQQQVAQWQRRVNELKKNAPPPPAKAMCVTDEEQPRDGHVHVRGGIRNLGELVPRGFLSVAMQPATDGSVSANIPTDASGRLQLAHWLTSPHHPLTARVMANRVWHHLTGQGLVRTTDNFGAMGERPSHPELLDYLAVTSREDNWSVKRLVRRIMLSRAYQLSSLATPEQKRADPDNELLARARRRRLDAESIRDAMLFVSGRLSPQAGGLTIHKLSQYDLSYDFLDTTLRSVYVPAFRNSRLELIEVFDGANPNVVTGRRTVSTLPTQALFLMNSPWVMQEARHAAQRLMADETDSASRVRLGYERFLGRPPSPAERRLAGQIVDPQNDEAGWARFCQLLMASLDFRYVY